MAVFHTLKRLSRTTLVVQKTGWRWLRNRQQPLPDLLLHAMEELGCTYIKLGQLIASSPSLFPDEYVQTFQHCLDQTTPVPFSEIEKVLEQEFGSRIPQLFRSIDPVPLASASIAQVHVATLINGEDVVIKVQKPGVEEVIRADFQFMLLAGRLTELINPAVPKSAVTDMIEELRNGMLEECDFIHEARNIDTYRDFLNSSNNTLVTVPKVYLHATTKRVLTMEHFHGVSLSNTDAVRQQVPHPEVALAATFNTWFASLVQCRLYHADLHAGNVMILDDGRVGFIDFGIVGHLSPQVWNALTSLAVHVPAQDYVAIAESLANMGATNKKVDIAQLAADLRDIITTLTGNLATVGNQNLDNMMSQITLRIAAVARQHGIRFPREFTLLVKQFLYFDRYIAMFAPNMDVFDTERRDWFAQQANSLDAD